MTARKPYLPRRSRISHAATVAAYAGVMGAALLAGVYWPVPRQPAFLIEAVTRSGHVYIAGSGSSCAAAWRGAELPADWTRTVCRRAR